MVRGTEAPFSWDKAMLVRVKFLSAKKDSAGNLTAWYGPPFQDGLLNLRYLESARPCDPGRLMDVEGACTVVVVGGVKYYLLGPPELLLAPHMRAANEFAPHSTDIMMGDGDR
jgi:hypothetical protein